MIKLAYVALGLDSSPGWQLTRRAVAEQVDTPHGGPVMSNSAPIRPARSPMAVRLKLQVCHLYCGMI
jgi:hypothetical protein